THYIHNYYGSNVAADLTEYPDNTIYKTSITDENNVKTMEFRDKFGNLVQSVTDSAGLMLTTKFEYDILGNMTKSIPPKGNPYSSSYVYNTLGQLVEKSSPDADTVKYLYDKNGNLRFIQDANHRSYSVNDVQILSNVNTGQTLT